MSPYAMVPACLLAGYLIGSISFAVLIAKSKGVDIFSVGSGNPGATNVLRVLGKPYGYACFLLDAFKGIAAVLLGKGISLQSGLDVEAMGILALLGAILGHSFSLFLNFRGGKGVATTVGGLLTLMPMIVLVGAAFWVIVFFATRYVSLASLVLGASLPFSALVFRVGTLSTGFCVFLAVLIFIRHRKNIQRLLAGTENRTGGAKS